MTGNDRRKIRSISAGQGMQGQGLSIERAADNIRGTMIQVANKVKPADSCTTSIERVDPYTAAISAIEDTKGLSDCDFINVCDAIMENPKIGSMYLAISKASSRSYFLKRRKKKINLNR